MDWNDETIGRLGTLWDEGHSTAEIGRRMGITKNAVVGKAHRLRLKPRPSPIRRGEAAPAEPRRAAAPRVVAAMVPASPARAPSPEGAAPAVRAARADPFRPFAAPSPGLRSSPCCWPIGEPGTRSFRFCDAAATTGKPYCAEHVQLAYVKVRDRRENAA